VLSPHLGSQEPSELQCKYVFFDQLLSIFSPHRIETLRFRFSARSWELLVYSIFKYICELRDQLRPRYLCLQLPSRIVSGICSQFTGFLIVFYQGLTAIVFLTICTANIVYPSPEIYSEMFVVPVGALFAFSSVRANFPGAPAGFGELRTDVSMSVLELSTVIGATIGHSPGIYIIRLLTVKYLQICSRLFLSWSSCRAALAWSHNVLWIWHWRSFFRRALHYFL